MATLVIPFIPGATGGSTGGGTTSIVDELVPSQSWQILASRAGRVAADGVVAHDAPIASTLPIIGGGRASSGIPAVVSADNDVSYNWVDLMGRQFVALHRTPIAPAAGVAGPLSVLCAVAANTVVPIIPAPGAGTAIHVLWVSVEASGSTAQIMELRQGTDVRLRMTTVNAGARQFFDFQSLPWRLPNATALNWISTAATSTQSVRVNVHYYVSA